ncbi:MAG: hypothetical protein LBT25_00495, partial [Candidatus Symbiothrix sp.]|nr:hypothetical protein [Candidatus Symbiothrix sp.]
VGDWSCIYIRSQSAGSKLNYCNISGGGGGSPDYKALLMVETGAGSPVFHAYLELNNTTFSRSQSYGIYLDQYSDSHKCYVTGGANASFSQCASGNVAREVGGRIVGVYSTLAEALAAQ